MKFKGMTKVHEGRFLTRYDLHYETEAGTPKDYEMISRSKNLQSFEELHDHAPEAVVLMVHDVTGEKVLLNREFRMAMGCVIYNFPAGLIDPGEQPDEAAARELWEETGLTLTSIRGYLDNSYSAIGFSNEKNICVMGTAEGEFAPSTSAEEEIEAGWYTKADIRKLIEEGAPFAARTQAYCYMWAFH
ncbi:MAG: NUDIX hydrolase [Oscillospiraceae bacterium]|nr:NUDIX hydrolase [Oscillospiraceae bacterium]